MIIFKLKSRNNSKYYYSFDGVGLYGVIVIDINTTEIAFFEVNGHDQNDQKEKEKLLYIAKKKIISMNFPDSCIYATH